MIKMIFFHKFLICLIVLGLTIGTVCVVCSETSPEAQEQNLMLPDWQSDSEKKGPQEQYQFFSPPKPSSKPGYLILDPDGQTPSDYQKLLDAQPPADKKPRR